MKIRSPLLLGSALLSVFAAHVSAQNVFFDFETAGQWSGNFRAIHTGGGTADQTSNGEANDFVKHDRITANGDDGTGAIYLYDATPGDTSTGTQSTFSVATNPLSVSFDLYAGPITSSFGVIFADASNLNNNVMAIFAVNNGADGFRFRSDTPMSWGAGNIVGADTNIATTIESGSIFTTGGNGLTATLSVTEGTPSISLTAGGETVSRNFSVGDLNWTDTVVLLRFFDNGPGAGVGVGIDNFAITQIPEPASAVLAAGLLAVSAGLLRRRRRS